MIAGRILTVLAVSCFITNFILAEEPAKTDAKDKETIAKGAKGEITGTITRKDGGKITINNGEKELVLWPYWRGGMPKDGGAFDKEMMKKIETLKVGDKVKATWTMEEHLRIDTIEKVETAQKAE